MYTSINLKKYNVDANLDASDRYKSCCVRSIPFDVPFRISVAIVEKRNYAIPWFVTYITNYFTWWKTQYHL